jgi:hypothetical protein
MKGALGGSIVLTQRPASDQALSSAEIGVLQEQGGQLLVRSHKLIRLHRSPTHGDLGCLHGKRSPRRLSCAPGSSRHRS